MSKADELLDRAQTLIERLESALSPARNNQDWDHIAYRWLGSGDLRAVAHPHLISLDDLLCMSQQKHEIIRNTEQFIARRGGYSYYKRPFLSISKVAKTRSVATHTGH